MTAQDLSRRIDVPDEETVGRPNVVAIVAAVALHLAILLWLLYGWSRLPPPVPPVIQATIVRSLPPPPPPPAPVAKKPPPPPAKQSPTLTARSSGPDQKTTAPPTAQETAPAPTAPPPTPAAPPKPPAPAPTPAASAIATAVPSPDRPPQQANPDETPPPPLEKPVPETPPEPRQDKLAAREIAPPLQNRAIGDKEETGDPYLNALWAKVEAQRAPTTPIGPSGLHLEGITEFELILGRSGTVEQLFLVRSSGSDELDAEAERMIAAAEPFPGLPMNFPDPTALRVTIRLFPR